MHDPNKPLVFGVSEKADRLKIELCITHSAIKVLSTYKFIYIYIFLGPLLCPLSTSQSAICVALKLNVYIEFLGEFGLQTFGMKNMSVIV